MCLRLYAPEERLFVHTHGGAYVLNGGRAGLAEAIIIAHRASIPVLSSDYRMPPEHPFPAAVEDVVAVWKSLLKKRDAKSMALGGTSAGGGLVLASTHKFIGLGIPVPGALFAGTPWADLTKTGDSYVTNEGVDYVLGQGWRRREARSPGAVRARSRRHVYRTRLEFPTSSSTPRTVPAPGDPARDRGPLPVR